MALTEQNTVDKVEVVENGSVQVRTANIVLKDGEELARNFHRHVVVPGQDYSAEDAKVQAICAAVHTQEVIDAYAASQEGA
jgi:archaellum component FlaF (FlaF/FlaG flagellin family)